MHPRLSLLTLFILLLHSSLIFAQEAPVAIELKGNQVELLKETTGLPVPFKQGILRVISPVPKTTPPWAYAFALTLPGNTEPEKDIFYIAKNFYSDITKKNLAKKLPKEKPVPCPPFTPKAEVPPEPVKESQPAEQAPQEVPVQNPPAQEPVKEQPKEPVRQVVEETTKNLEEIKNANTPPVVCEPGACPPAEEYVPLGPPLPPEYNLKDLPTPALENWSFAQARDFIENSKFDYSDLKIISRTEWGAKKNLRELPNAEANLTAIKVELQGIPLKIKRLTQQKNKLKPSQFKNKEDFNRAYDGLMDQIESLDNRKDQISDQIDKYPDFEKGPITKITIHHTADFSIAGKNDAVRIQDGHINKYADIGYHYVIGKDKDGKWQVFEGRDKKFIGAHAGKGYNTGNLGIAIVYNAQPRYPDDPLRTNASGFDLKNTPENKRQPPPEAVALLGKLVNKLVKENTKIATIHGHSLSGPKLDAELKLKKRAPYKDEYGGMNATPNGNPVFFDHTACPGEGCLHIVDSLGSRFERDLFGREEGKKK